MTETPRLQLKGMTKVYPSVIANDSIDMTIGPGEIHAVLGENGEDIYFKQNTFLNSVDVPIIVQTIRTWLQVYEKSICL